LFKGFNFVAGVGAVNNAFRANWVTSTSKTVIANVLLRMCLAHVR
jgi:hypothetical protein